MESVGRHENDVSQSRLGSIATPTESIMRSFQIDQQNFSFRRWLSKNQEPCKGDVYLFLYFKPPKETKLQFQEGSLTGHVAVIFLLPRRRQVATIASATCYSPLHHVTLAVSSATVGVILINAAS